MKFSDWFKKKKGHVKLEGVVSSPDAGGIDHGDTFEAYGFSATRYPDKNYYLGILMEECLEISREATEVGQAASKIMRFGDDHNYTGNTNLENLAKEINDLLAVVIRMEKRGMLPPGFISQNAIAEKLLRMDHFRKISEDLNLC